MSNNAQTPPSTSGPDVPTTPETTQSVTAAAPATKTNAVKPLLILLLVIFAILIAVVAYLAGQNNGAAGNAATQQATQESMQQNPQTQEQSTQQQQTQEQPAQNPENQPAQKITDPNQVAAMKAQVHRKDGDPRAQGRVDAPVVMVEYGDFSCPMCAKYELSTAQALQKYVDAGQLRIEWRDMSFFRNYNSQLAAAGGIAAANQGKFWEYKHAAYELSANGDHPNWSDDLVKQVAQKAGVADLDKFMADYKNPETLKQVDAETDAAQRLGITGTPFFIINDRFISGAWPTPHFLATIEAALADAK